MLHMAEPELDLVDAVQRRDLAAARAKQLEEQGEGWAALEAWKEYELISAAIEGQERSEKAAARARSSGAASSR